MCGFIIVIKEERKENRRPLSYDCRSRCARPTDSRLRRPSAVIIRYQKERFKKASGHNINE